MAAPLVRQAHEPSGRADQVPIEPRRERTSQLLRVMSSKLHDNRTRLVRYGATSLLALGISEITLVLIVAKNVNPTAAAFAANVAGMLPSYLLSRYWIWANARRDHAGRQVVLYWITSLASMTITSLTTGAIGATAPRHGALRLVITGAAFFAVSVVLWLTKFVVYQRGIFPQDSPEADEPI